MDLSGKTALVTGAGTGIGRALALAFARHGAAVACAGRREAPLRETAALIAAEGGRALAIPADVTSATEVEHLVAAVVAAFGPLDVLFNNAGSYRSVGPLWESDPETWWEDVTINLRGVMLCCRAALPAMMARNQGILINMTSGAALAPHLGGAAYGSAKTAVTRLSETLARELDQVGSAVRVYALDPGFNRTAMTESLARAAGADFWLPHVGRLMESAEAKQPEDCAATAVELIRLAPAALHGRFIAVGDDIAALAARVAATDERDPLTLRLRRP